MLTIPAKMLKALLITAPKADARYYLNGVHFQWREATRDTLYASTDGHRLTVYRDETEPDTVLALLNEGIIPRDYCEQVARIANPYHDLQLVVFYDANGKPSVRHAESGMTTALIDGRYPDYMKVIPSTFPEIGKTAQFNPLYFADLAKIAKLIGSVTDRGKTPLVSVHHNGPETIAIARFNTPDLFSAIMPMRADLTGSGVPDWLRGPEVEPAQTEPEAA